MGYYPTVAETASVAIPEFVRASVARAPYQGQADGDNVRGGLPLDVSWLSGLTAVTR